MTKSEAKDIARIAETYKAAIADAKSKGCNIIRATQLISLENMELIVQALESYDVCEWKKDSIFLRTSCNDIVRTWSDDFKYCPYCSKRIKMVGNDK